MSISGNPTVRRLALIGIPMSFFVMGLKLLAWWLTGSVAQRSRSAPTIDAVGGMSVAAARAWLNRLRFPNREAQIARDKVVEGL